MEDQEPLVTGHPPLHPTFFDSDWDLRSPARVFVPSAPKQRAWERRGRATTSKNKSRTIMKRYDLRKPDIEPPRAAESEKDRLASADIPEHEATPDGKILKKLRMRKSITGITPRKSHLRGITARADRRESVLPHKQVVQQVATSPVAVPNEAQADHHQEQLSPAESGDVSIAPRSDSAVQPNTDNWSEQTQDGEPPVAEDGMGKTGSSAEPVTIDTTTPKKQIIDEASAEDLATVTPWVQLAAHADRILQNSDVDYEQEAEHEMMSLTHEQRLDKDQKVLEAFESAILGWEENDRDASRHRLRETASARKGRRYTEFVDLMDRTYWPGDRRYSMPTIPLQQPGTMVQADVRSRIESSPHLDAQQNSPANNASVVDEPAIDIVATAPLPEALATAASDHPEGSFCMSKGTHSKLKRRRTEAQTTVKLNEDAASKRRASTALEAVAASRKPATTTATRRSKRKDRVDRRQTELVSRTKAVSDIRRASTALDRLTETANIDRVVSPDFATSPKEDHQKDPEPVADESIEHAASAETPSVTASNDLNNPQMHALDRDEAGTVPQRGLVRAEDVSNTKQVKHKLTTNIVGARRQTFAPLREGRAATTPRKRRASTALEAFSHGEASPPRTELQSTHEDETAVSAATNSAPAEACKPRSKRTLRSSSRMVDRRMTEGPTVGNTHPSSGEVRRASVALDTLAFPTPASGSSDAVGMEEADASTHVEPIHPLEKEDSPIDQTDLSKAELTARITPDDERPSSPALSVSRSLAAGPDALHGSEPRDGSIQDIFAALADVLELPEQTEPLPEPVEAMTPRASTAEGAVAEEASGDRSSTAPQSPIYGIEQEVVGTGGDKTVNIETLQRPAERTPSSSSPSEPSGTSGSETMVDDRQEMSPSPNEDAGEDTATIRVQLNDEDTDMLKDFLNRSKASKAAKIAERAHIDSRRDSDIIKAALASPRPALEVIDGNSSSPRKTTSASAELNSSPVPAESQQLPVPAAELLSANTDGLGDEDELASTEPAFDLENDTLDLASLSGRRSGRTPKFSRNTPSSISLRRQGGDGEPIALKKSEAQQLALLTRSNTRRNKGGAVSARLMLTKLKGVPVEEGSSAIDSPEVNAKVRWNEQLVAFFDESKKDGLVSLESAPDKVEAEANASKPRAKRSRTLGATNGTPAKPRMKDVSASVDPLELDSSTKDATKPAVPASGTPAAKPRAKTSSKATSLQAATAPATDSAATANDATTLAETSVSAPVAAAEKPASTTSTPATQLPKPTKKPRGIPTPAKRQPSTASQPPSAVQKPAATPTPASSQPQPPASTKKALPTPSTTYTGIAASGRATRKQVHAAADKENKTPDVILEAKTRSVAEPPRRSVLPRMGGAR